MKTIYIKRIYEEPNENDGYRILIDRLWPRGVTKSKANLDEWNKEVAPSTVLRKWFDHQAANFEEFSLRYQEELLLKEDELNRLRSIAKLKTISLLYAAKDPKINHAVVLRNLLIKE
jgi:uncharacterized protein YeaO (DUF488 family)